jgi:hypothetical protein
MRIEVYRATDAEDVPGMIIQTFDSLDDHFVAAFYNYPHTVKYVVAAWGTTGAVDGEPLAVLIATAGHIITGYVDTYFDSTTDPEDRIEHDEPNPIQRRAALLARLRKVSKAAWLLIHDADEIDGWIAHGFRGIDPPPDVPADEAVVVLAWGELPEDAEALVRARGLSWRRQAHRFGQA